MRESSDQAIGWRAFSVLTAFSTINYNLEENHQAPLPIAEVGRILIRGI